MEAVKNEREGKTAIVDINGQVLFKGDLFDAFWHNLQAIIYNV